MRVRESQGGIQIHINIDNKRNQFLEIKDISTVIDMDTNKAHPVLHIDKIEIDEK